MNEERLRRLHRLRKADTDERALTVARDEARLRDAEAAEAESIRRRDGLRAELAEATRAGAQMRADLLADRHEVAEHGVRSVVRFTRHVAERDRLLQASREAARRARTEEERVQVLLVAAMEERRRAALEAEEKERDEMATIRRGFQTAEENDASMGGERL